MAQRPYQRNAADPRQIRFAARKAKQREARFQTALRAVLQTIEGRIVMTELLQRAGVNRSVWDPSARIHYNAGRQDYGHELMATILEVDEQAFLRMQAEHRAWLKQEEREVAAHQTASATEEHDGRTDD